MHMTSNANCLPLGPLSDLGGFERVAAHVNRAQILTSITILDASPSQAAGGARWASRSHCTIIRRGSLALSLKSTTAHRLLSRVVHNAPDSTWAVHELEDVLAAEASICFTSRGGGAVLHQPQTRCCSMFIPLSAQKPATVTWGRLLELTVFQLISFQSRSAACQTQVALYRPVLSQCWVVCLYF